MILLDLPYALRPDRSMAKQAERTDRDVAEALRQLDILLAAWVGRPVKRMELVDQYLDERLYHRPPDAMATWPAGRPS